MKMDLYQQSEAEYLINMLHSQHIDYTLTYKTSEDQRDGRSNAWTFEFDASQVVRGMLKA